MSVERYILEYAEKGYIPDFAVRAAVKMLLLNRLKVVSPKNPEKRLELVMAFIADLKSAPIAPVLSEQRQLHYDLPSAFFEIILGKHMKYSCALFGKECVDLTDAEEAMLDLTCSRADIHNGQSILELGCGWGSLSLWLAKWYPKCKITTVSHSKAQAMYIREMVKERGIANLSIITADMNDFDAKWHFDRVISIEMFGYMRNYELLMERICSWLKKDGKFFLQTYSHDDVPYFFSEEGTYDWLGRYFLHETIMPSNTLPLFYQKDASVEKQWIVQGTHYKKTTDMWLENLTAHKKQVMQILEFVYGKDDALIWYHRWRIFFMACSEMWGYKRGTEWFVSQYLFTKKI